MRGAQPPNVIGAIWELLEERVHLAAFEAGSGEPWGHAATEQAVMAERMTGLPGLGRQQKLHALACRNIRAENHVLARAIRVQQHQPQRIAVVKVPEFIVLQSVKTREAVGLVGVQTNDGSADRITVGCLLARDVGAGKQRAFDR